MNKKIISKIKKSGLLGRSGSSFPVWKKWEILDKYKQKRKYIICNGSEGELETHKDGFILKKYPEEVIDGIKIAADVLNVSKSFIYLRKDYFKKFKKKLEKFTDKSIFIYEKKGDYIAGEETSIIELIEGKKAFPRIKPPFPCESGLWQCPTLVHNVETFYCVSKILKDNYQNERFYSISGDTKNNGVFELKDGISIKEILTKTNNYPAFDFFLQVGGGGCGKIMTKNELNSEIKNLASIIIYNKKETDPYFLMKKWIDFLLNGNCDKCVPCREGIYRISEMINKKDLSGIKDIFFVLEKTSRCPLGKMSVVPFESLINKIIKNK